MTRDEVTADAPQRGSRLLDITSSQRARPIEFAGVRAISFDLDDTLWDFRLAVQRAEDELKSWLGQAAPATADVLLSANDLQRYRQNVVRQRPDLAYRLDLIRLESIRQLLLDADEDADLAVDAYEVFYRARQRPALFDDVLPALEWLSRRYRLVAVTNGNSDLKASGLRQYFCEVFTAARLGFGKPDRRIFRAAAEVIGVPEEGVLHVGDDLALDVRGALSAGMQAAWLVRARLRRTPSESPPDDYSGLCISDLGELCEILGARAHLA